MANKTAAAESASKPNEWTKNERLILEWGTGIMGLGVMVYAGFKWYDDAEELVAGGGLVFLLAMLGLHVYLLHVWRRDGTLGEPRLLRTRLAVALVQEADERLLANRGREPCQTHGAADCLTCVILSKPEA